MKTSRFRSVSLARLLVFSVLGLAQAGAQTANPPIPVGVLSATPTVVQTGTKPTLNWNITYPQVVKDVVTIDPGNGTVTTKTNLKMDVRVLGAQIGNGTDWYKVQAELKEGTGSWTQFFNAKQTGINTNTIYHTRTVSSNKGLTFRGRAASNNASNPTSWQSYFQTGATGSNVRVLVNGDSPPSYVPAFKNQSTIKSAVGAYLKDGKISIGPMDIIVLYELWGTDTKASYFDMQDLVLLVTFTKV